MDFESNPELAYLLVLQHLTLFAVLFANATVERAVPAAVAVLVLTYAFVR